jgi:hypothetical protein
MASSRAIELENLASQKYPMLTFELKNKVYFHFFTFYETNALDFTYATILYIKSTSVSVCLSVCLGSFQALPGPLFLFIF